MTAEPFRTRVGRKSVQIGTGVAVAVAGYVALYLVSRTAHQDRSGKISVELGSRFSDQLFAPLAGIEKRMRDRVVPQAEPLIESALAEARASGRTVLLTLGSKTCLPCRQLERFLADQSAIIDKHFVIVKVNIDDELNRGELVRARYRVPRMNPEMVEYFPWIAFLDQSGELSVTADDGPPGRIGIPQGGAEERAWFLAMLKRAHPAITADELDHLGTAAAAWHELLWNTPSDRVPRAAQPAPAD